MSKKGLYLAAIGSVLTVIVILVCEWNVEKDREKMTRTTQGIVVSFDPYNHGAIKYAYSVAGQRYMGSQSQGNGHLLGSLDQVHYDPSNPQLSIFGEIPPPMNITCLVEVIGAYIGCFILIFMLGRREASFRRKLRC